MTVFAVCSIFDRVAETYGRPMFMPNKGSAVRSIAAEVNNPQAGMLYDKPRDFVLIGLGWFDDQTGKFDPFLESQVWCECVELKDQTGPISA